MCHLCGYTDKKNRNNQEFKCLSCSYNLNADLNAAKNIAAKASINKPNVAVKSNLAQAPNSQVSLPVTNQQNLSVYV